MRKKERTLLDCRSKLQQQPATTTTMTVYDRKEREEEEEENGNSRTNLLHINMKWI